MKPEEMETHLNMTADERGYWYVYSDDPLMIKKLDKIGEKLATSTYGSRYRLAASQVRLVSKRTTKRLSAEETEKRRERMKSIRAKEKSND